MSLFCLRSVQVGGGIFLVGGVDGGLMVDGLREDGLYQEDPGTG